VLLALTTARGSKSITLLSLPFLVRCGNQLFLLRLVVLSERIFNLIVSSKIQKEIKIEGS